MCDVYQPNRTLIIDIGSRKLESDDGTGIETVLSCLDSYFNSTAIFNPTNESRSSPTALLTSILDGEVGPSIKDNVAGPLGECFLS